MYSKANPQAGELTPRRKRVLLAVCVVVVLALGGLGAWSAFAHDGYTASGNGCVSVTVPSSTGGATLRYCGAPARSFCRAEYAQHDALARLARPRCATAGIGPSATGRG